MSTDGRTGLSPDPSPLGCARWLVDLIDQLDHDGVRGVLGGGATLRAVDDLRRALTEADGPQTTIPGTIEPQAGRSDDRAVKRAGGRAPKATGQTSLF